MRNEPSPTLPKITDQLDQVFGFLSIKRGWATREMLESLAAIKERPFAVGLIRQGRITPQQADEVLEEIAEKIIYCDSCRIVFSGTQPEAGKRYRCRKCLAEIAYPQGVSLEARRLMGEEMEMNEADLPSSPPALPLKAVQPYRDGKGRRNGTGPPLFLNNH